MRRDEAIATTSSRTQTRAALWVGVAAAALLLLAGASTASAQSETTGNINVKLGPYYPSIDEEFGGQSQPFQESFGNDKRLLGQFAAEYYLWQGHGKFAVGVTAGYTNFTGTSDIQGDTGGGDGDGGGGDGSGGGDGGDGEANGGDGGDEGVNLSEETKFRVFPIGLITSYRWDWLIEEFNVPLAPKVEAGLDYYLWRVKDGAGNISRAGGDDSRAAGAVPGYHVAARLEFLLDAIDPETAAAFDMNWGINNSFLFAEYNYSNVDGFGGEHLRLGDTTWKVGLGFEF